MTLDWETLVLCVLLLALGSMFSAMHACLTEMSRSTLEGLAARQSSSLRRSIARILADIDGHARAAALARIVCNLAVAACAVWLAADLRAVQSPELLDGIIGVAVAAIVLWLFSVTLAESIAAHAAERFVISFSPLVRATYLAQKPLAPLARGIDTLVRKLSGVTKVSKQTEITDEILEVVEEGEREGALDEEEGRMIEAVMKFKSLTVEQIMTPRTEVEALEMTGNLGTITAFVRKVRHSRVPVYKAGGTLDDVVGFFYVKDLLRWLAGDQLAGAPAPAGPQARPHGFDLKALVRPAYFVPATKTVREVLDELLEKKVHAAIVADEYGGMAGMVTIEDIVEEVFGDIQDEYEKAEDDPPRIEVKPDDQLADIDARAVVADVNQAIEPLDLSVPESDEYDTLGGFVMAHLGRMPEVNESFPVGRMLVTVLEASPTRVLRVRLQVREDEAAMTNTDAPQPAAESGR